MKEISTSEFVGISLCYLSLFTCLLLYYNHLFSFTPVVKLPGHRPGLPGKEVSLYCAPSCLPVGRDPATRRGLQGTFRPIANLTSNIGDPAQRRVRSLFYENYILLFIYHPGSMFFNDEISALVHSNHPVLMKIHIIGFALICLCLPIDIETDRETAYLISGNL